MLPRGHGTGKRHDHRWSLVSRPLKIRKSWSHREECKKGGGPGRWSTKSKEQKVSRCRTTWRKVKTFILAGVKGPWKGPVVNGNGKLYRIFSVKHGVKDLLSDLNLFEQENKNLCHLSDKSGCKMCGELDREDPGDAEVN